MIPKIGSYIEQIEELDSTNNYASSLLLKKRPPEGTVILAKKQSKGRGQSTNVWESEGGKNLTFSIILYPSFVSLSQQFEISKAVSLGVADFLGMHVDEVAIKWPNDIYVRKGKIAGILMEYAIQKKTISSCIIGIGLNVNQEKFYSDAPNPVSLTQLTGRIHSLDDCLAELLDKIGSRYRELADGDFGKIDEDYQKLLYQKGCWASYSSKGGVFEGKIIGVDEYGLLMIEGRQKQILKFDYKEVSFLG
jgi:BirA family biotin operon repressor/biotin-[acetyl-CoA-carboxylase] ligase